MTEQARIWEYYQNKHPESFSWGRSRLDFLVKRVVGLGQGPLRVFTVGAGDGHLERSLHARGHTITSLDLDRETAERLTQGGIRGLQGELSSFDGDGGPYDVAVASEVLEHIPADDLPESVKRVHAALKPAGKFLVTVPFRENLARNTTMCPSCGHEHHLWGHVQSFDEEQLELLFRDAGFREVSVSAKFFANYRQLNWGGRFTFFLKHVMWVLFRRTSSSLKYYVEAVK